MDKLTMAHDWFISSINNGKHVTIEQAWCYADAMQAEADERINKERPKVFFDLKPKCEVDWTQAPSNAIGWMFFDGVSTWLGEDGFLIEDAPLFGFTDPCIMERPNGF